MKNEMLLRAIGNIDDTLIHNAVNDVPKRKNHIWLKYGTIAVCLCVMVAGGIVLSKNGLSKNGTGHECGAEGDYSFAVFPASEDFENVYSAKVTSVTENEMSNNDLAEYLPVQLPDGFHYGRGSVYNTTMKDGTQYNMIRVEYITGTIPEQQFSVDGGAIAPELKDIGELFTIRVMDYEPETNINIYSDADEITKSILEENGSVYIRSDNCYVGIFVETATPEAVLETIGCIS